jgi:hypothetical protein
MNYEVLGEGNKIAGQLNSAGHLVNVMDPELQEVFSKMEAQGITELSAPDKKPAKGIYADKATTTSFKDATAEQIIATIQFYGFRVVLEGTPAT